MSSGQQAYQNLFYHFFLSDNVFVQHCTGALQGGKV
jgi:hypothetical protein